MVAFMTWETYPELHKIDFFSEWDWMARGWTTQSSVQSFLTTFGVHILQTTLQWKWFILVFVLSSHFVCVHSSLSSVTCLTLWLLDIGIESLISRISAGLSDTQDFLSLTGRATAVSTSSQVS